MLKKCNIHIKYFDKIKCNADRTYLVFSELKPEIHIYVLALAFNIPYSKMTTLYLAPTCMRARRHQESLISTLHQVIRILCNQNCVFKWEIVNYVLLFIVFFSSTYLFASESAKYYDRKFCTV